MSAAALSPPTGLMPRFSQFINGIKRTIGDIVLYRHEVMPLILPLGAFLTATQRRLTALHARFVAGKLAAAPRAPRPGAERAPTERTLSERRPPAIPPGPVLLTVFRAGFDEMLQALLDDPEMRALLAASPQAGRILRPLWRKLSPRPLPAVLRLPPRPRKPRPARVARSESRGGTPSPQPLVCSSQPKPPSGGEGEGGRPAWWTYPVSLWADPAPAAEPPTSPPPWPPPPLRA
jgi:hypothetical protein